MTNIFWGMIQPRMDQITLVTNVKDLVTRSVCKIKVQSPAFCRRWETENQQMSLIGRNRKHNPAHDSLLLNLTYCLLDTFQIYFKNHLKQHYFEPFVVYHFVVLQLYTISQEDGFFRVCFLIEA